jgi:hypothetical protein
VRALPAYAVGDSTALVCGGLLRVVFATTVAAAAVGLVAPSTVAPASPAREASVEAYAGLGTWVDVYDAAAWAQPERVVGVMSARGVETLFLQTSNYRRAEDVVRPDRIARFIAAAHDRGINVVAWYLPSLSDLARDYRRTMRAIRFQTFDGDGFDSFALDIEAGVVRSPTLRTARLLRLSSSVRRSVGPSYPLGAIVPSGRRFRLDPGYWPGFPYRGLAQSFDVFLPMTYFAYGASGARGRLDTLRDVALIRRGTRDPAVEIHVIGGIASLARPSEVKAFVGAALACDVLGVSLYDFVSTRLPQWAALSRVTLALGNVPETCR